MTISQVEIFKNANEELWSPYPNAETKGQASIPVFFSLDRHPGLSKAQEWQPTSIYSDISPCLLAAKERDAKLSKLGYLLESMNARADFPTIAGAVDRRIATLVAGLCTRSNPWRGCGYCSSFQPVERAVGVQGTRP